MKIFYKICLFFCLCFSINALLYANAYEVKFSTTPVKVYPVPWIPEDGKTKTGNLTDGITFSGLPNTGEVLIYTISGKLVYNYSFENNIKGTLKWVGQSNGNQKVASGVYLWIVKSDSHKETGKLIVVR